MVIVTFSDGKSFLGDAKKTGNNYSISFHHSGSVYLFTDPGIILKSGGAYKAGSEARIFCVDPTPIFNHR